MAKKSTCRNHHQLKTKVPIVAFPFFSHNAVMTEGISTGVVLANNMGGNEYKMELDASLTQAAG